MIIYHWRLYGPEYPDLGDTEEIVINEGVETESIEVFVNYIVPDGPDGIDRDLSEMQEYLDEYYPERKYRFEFYETDLIWNDELFLDDDESDKGEEDNHETSK